MNGVHDVGGMHGMGPIEYEKDEPVFHEEWEGRVYALSRALGAVPGYRSTRHDVELLPPADYLRMSYYERWLARILNLIVKHGLVTPTELQSGTPDPGSRRGTPPFTPEIAAASIRRRPEVRRKEPIAPRFTAGQRVRSRNIHPIGHTRLPRYARGRVGTITADYGVFAFPDTETHGLGPKPQHVYNVRFTARELWGDQTSPRDSVSLDLWEDYLERV
jgi:nitrile hydratase